MIRDVKRLRCILWDVLTALSLALCLGTAGDWANSYRYYWSIGREGDSGTTDERPWMCTTNMTCKTFSTRS
jgi:hypothetical protein